MSNRKPEELNAISELLMVDFCDIHSPDLSFSQILNNHQQQYLSSREIQEERQMPPKPPKKFIFKPVQKNFLKQSFPLANDKAALTINCIDYEQQIPEKQHQPGNSRFRFVTPITLKQKSFTPTADSLVCQSQKVFSTRAVKSPRFNFLEQAFDQDKEEFIRYKQKNFKTERTSMSVQQPSSKQLEMEEKIQKEKLMLQDRLIELYKEYQKKQSQTPKLLQKNSTQTKKLTNLNLMMNKSGGKFFSNFYLKSPEQQQTVKQLFKDSNDQELMKYDMKIEKKFLLKTPKNSNNNDKENLYRYNSQKYLNQLSPKSRPKKLQYDQPFKELMKQQRFPKLKENIAAAPNNASYSKFNNFESSNSQGGFTKQQFKQMFMDNKLYMFTQSKLNQ